MAGAKSPCPEIIRAIEKGRSEASDAPTRIMECEVCRCVRDELIEREAGFDGLGRLVMHSFGDCGLLGEGDAWGGGNNDVGAARLVI